MPLSPEQLSEIKTQRDRSSQTRRPTVSAMEELLLNAVPMLDHGFIRVIDYMGDDAAVVQAARVSYGRGTRKPNEDAGLIRYLLRHKHTTPFEMCEIKLHVKLPIFVARQWIRHRTANVNEYSARYSILDQEFYVPEPEHLAVQSHANRQGRGATLDAKQAALVREMLHSDAARAYDNYTHLLNDDGSGNPADPERDMLARELARMGLSLNFYTQWYWKTNLHNLFNFLRLRADSHAQFEIRVYAEEMLKIVEAWVPQSFAAFKDYVHDAFTLSGPMVKILRHMLAGEKIDQKSSGLSKREWDEMMAQLRPTPTDDQQPLL